MLRRGFVALGLAVLLSLLFPVQAVLRHSGIDPLALHLPVLDLAGLCALAAVLPAMALCRDGQLAARIPRWNVWLALLAFFSLLFVALHVSWSLQLATDFLRDALAPGGSLPLRVSHRTVLHAAELVSRLGVLVSMVGVLVHLQAVPDPDAAPPRRRERRRK